MLEEKEKQFVDYWEKNRDKEGDLVYQLLTGLPIGLLFSLPILIILLSGRYWFRRADMVANSQLSITVMVIAILLISAFVAVLYKRHKWEMKDQQYRELKLKDSANR